MTETNTNNHISEEQLQELSLKLKYNEEQSINLAQRCKNNVTQIKDELNNSNIPQKNILNKFVSFISNSDIENHLLNLDTCEELINDCVEQISQLDFEKDKKEFILLKIIINNLEAYQSSYNNFF